MRAVQNSELPSLVSNSGDQIREELLAKPHMPVGGLLLKYAQEFRALGIRNPKKQILGKGSFGVAYSVEIDGVQSVLKITRDPYEVLSSFALQGRSTQRIVPIYGVWGCSQSVPKGKRGEAWLGWFVIHRDILQPVSQADAKTLEALYELYIDQDIDLWVPKVGAAGRAMREKWRININERLSPHQTQRAMTLLDEISLGVREMLKYGIDWADFHSDNMMRDRKKVLRISDVGFGIPRQNFEVEPPEFALDSVLEHVATLSAAKEK